LVPGWNPLIVVELVIAFVVVVMVEDEKTDVVDVKDDVIVVVVLDVPTHPEGQYWAANVFPREVRMLTYTLPDVRQWTQDVDRMPMAHPTEVPQPVRELVPSPMAKDMGKVTFRSPVSWVPLVRNSDPREDGFVEEERAFPDSVVTKTAVIVTGIPPELDALTSRTHPLHDGLDPGPAVTARLSALAPWTPPCLAMAALAEESEACPAYT
jgi:hypothetical protein